MSIAPFNQHNFNLLVILSTSIGGLLYGYNLGSMPGVVLIMQKNYSISTEQISIFVAAFLFGITIIMPFAGYLAGKIGRKKLFATGVFLSLLSLILLLSSESILWLTIFRCLTGIATGVLNIAIPLYISETVPANIRGRGTVAFQLFLTAGILLSTIISLLLFQYDSWRYIFAFELFPIFIMLVAICFIPESPRWLMIKGRYSSCLKSLLATRNVVQTKKEYNKMKLRKPTKSKFPNDFFDTRNIKILILVIALVSLNQLMGINAFIQYIPVIFKSLNFGDGNYSLIASVVAMVINFMMTVIAIYIVDKIERKTLLMCGVIGCSFFLLLSAFWPKSSHHIVVFLLAGFLVFFAIGPGALVWTILSELLPTNIRSIGMAIALTLSSFSGFLITIVFLPLVSHIGIHGVFLICGIFGLIYFILSFFLPNTKGKSLEEIGIYDGQEETGNINYGKGIYDV